MENKYRQFIGVTVFVIAMSFSAGLLARAELEYVTVEVKGVGDTSQDAINSAIVERWAGSMANPLQQKMP